MLQRKGHTPEAVKATVDLAAHPETAEQEAVTVQGLGQERGEQVLELAQVAEQDLGGEPEQAAEREAVTVQGLDQERGQQVLGLAQVAEQDLGGEPEQAAERER